MNQGTSDNTLIHNSSDLYNKWIIYSLLKLKFSLYNRLKSNFLEKISVIKSWWFDSYIFFNLSNSYLAIEFSSKLEKSMLKKN